MWKHEEEPRGPRAVNKFVCCRSTTTTTTKIDRIPNENIWGGGGGGGAGVREKKPHRFSMDTMTDRRGGHEVDVEDDLR